MTRDEFQTFHKEFCVDARAICKKKSKDYAKDEDVFLNFTKCERDGLCSTDTGLMVRLSDKMIRLPNVIKNGNACLDETALDTIQDAVNYLILLAGWLSRERTQQLTLPKDEDKSLPANLPKGYTAGPGEHKTYFEKEEIIVPILTENEKFNQMIDEARRVAKETAGE